MKSFVLLGLLCLAALTGCGDKSASPIPPPPPVTVAAPKLPTHAQSKLPAIRLWLGASELSTEMALTPIQQATGMMFRTNLDENAGMIFPLPYPMQASFWMTNCPLPLSLAYMDPEGQILEIHELHANDAVPVKSEAENILYVLEVNKDWFDRHHIKPGTIVRTEKGTLRETFVRSTP